jgi:hypothetical protein
MTTGMFCLPSSQSNPFLIHDLSPGFNKSKTTGATRGEESAYPPGFTVDIFFTSLFLFIKMTNKAKKQTKTKVDFLHYKKSLNIPN